MKYLVLSLLFFTSFFAQNYKKIEININSKDEIISLKKVGIVDAVPVFGQNKKSIQAFVEEKQIEKLEQLGISYSILIEDWKSYYESRDKMTDLQKKSALEQSKLIYGVSGFDYGSMGGFLTADEVYAKLDEMRTNYPSLISEKFSIGNTLENRPMYIVKISDNPEIDEEEPEVFYNSLIHAREPEAMMQMIYFMFYLLENYGIDDEATYLVNNREMYFLPVFNVDGYIYNQTIAPNGGGMNRKNRSYNSDGTRGVDLNRNWGYKWGYNDIGSSGEGYAETYRGSSAFSEPETDNVRLFVNSRHFVTALNYHTYSNLLIIPWGYIDAQVPDSLIFWEYAANMTQFNGYTWGNSSDIIYEVNGAADDWMYGEQFEKNKIISMTPEVGSSSDGFWPPESRILPLAQENLYPNLFLAWVAGEFVSLDEVIYQNEFINPGDTTKAVIKIKNLGLSDASNIVVTFTSLSAQLTINGRPIIIQNLPARESSISTDSLQLIVSEEATIAEEIHFFATISMNGNLIYRDTVAFTVGTPEIIFEDTTNVIETLWTLSSSNSSQKWDEIASDFVSSPNSYTDSKNGDYYDDITNKFYLTNSIDLTDAVNPFLSFQTKWDIESGWDCARVSVSTNNGSSWIDRPGLYTKNANGHGKQLPIGAPIYDGVKSEWVEERIDLADFVGQNIKIRFMLESDEYVVGDGFFVDEINIWQYSDSQVDIDDISNLPKEYSLSQNYPNPFNPSTIIKFSIPQSSKSENVTLKIYDVLGKEVATLVNKNLSAGEYQINFNGINLSSGVYFYKINAGNFIQTKKMLLVK